MKLSTCVMADDHKMLRWHWLHNGHHKLLMHPRWRLGGCEVGVRQSVAATVDDVVASQKEVPGLERAHRHWRGRCGGWWSSRRLQRLRRRGWMGSKLVFLKLWGIGNWRGRGGGLCPGARNKARRWDFGHLDGRVRRLVKNNPS